MNIRRFEANDTRSALRLVRAELGADAVILSNRSTENGIEIISAADFDESLFSVLKTPEVAKDKEDSMTESNSETDASDASLDHIREEIQSIKELVAYQLPVQTNDTENFDLPTSVRFNQLVKLGFERELSLRLAGELNDISRLSIGEDALQALLEEQIAVCQNSLIEDGGLAAFVGPTGVGKTTTIAKVAMQASLRFGAASVALVSADDQRIGAQEQLERIASLLGIRLYSCHRPSELPELLGILQSTRLVLIDTAGVSQFDPRLDLMLANLRAASTELKLYLTLAANAQLSCLENTLQRYIGSRPDALMLTKIDECLQLGPALSVLCNSQIKLSMLSDGPGIPDDLKMARTSLKWLTRLTLNREDCESIANLDFATRAELKEKFHASI